MKYKLLGLLILGSIKFVFAQNWTTITTTNNSTERGENSVVAIGDNLYLFGCRGMKPLEVLNTKTNTWTKKSVPPIEMHHFQGVVFKGEIYVVGALTGPYPHETPIPNVYIYNPASDTWRVGPEIPRKRGAAACFVYNDKIYVLCGIIDGHWDGHVAWFDEFNPATGEWKILPNALHARDHVSAAMVGTQVVVAGGRLSTARINKVLDLTVPETDVYDFATNNWHNVEGQNIPTMRAGASVAVLGNQVLFMGGESPTQVPAHEHVEAFDIKTMKWSSLKPMNQGRHGTGAAKIGKKIFITGGIGKRGGSPELNSTEYYK